MSEPIREFEEMYMKTLYGLAEENSGEPIRTSQVADAMQVSAASASEMLKRLGGKGLLDHEPYKGVHLTEEGLAFASRVKRREGLMEVFLVQMLDFEGDVHDAACRLEHALTDELELAIDRLLDYPEVTPSGESIPQVRRDIDADLSHLLLPLKALPEGVSATIELLVLDGVERRTLTEQGLHAGAEVRRVQDVFEIAGTEIQISDSLQARILARTR